MLIPKQVFPIVAIAAREATPFFSINSVRIAREGEECTAVVTDGSRMLEVRWPDDDETRKDYPSRQDDTLLTTVGGFERLVSRALWTEASKLADGKALQPIVRNTVCREQYPDEGPHVEFSATDLDVVHTCSGGPCDGKFPNYKAHIPHYVDDECTRIGFDAKILSELLRTMLKCGLGGDNQSGDNCVLEFVVPHDPTRPMVLRSKSDTVQGTGAIIPCALDS